MCQWEFTGFVYSVELTWISNPCVENPPSLLWPQLWRVVKSPGQHLLAESHHIWRGLKTKVLVCPHLPRGPASRLDLIHEVDNVMPFADVLKPLEPGIASMVIPTL